MTKDVIVKEIKKQRKKVFTKKRSNSTIKKKHNPLKTSKNRKRRDGLYSMKNEELNKLKMDIGNKYKVKEKVVEIFFEKCKEEGYSTEESKKIIIDFLKQDNLSKTCPLI